MDMEHAHALVQRYERGERDHELLASLDQAAWECFHDPWEVRTPEPLGPESFQRGHLPMPWPPDEAVSISASTINLYMSERFQDQFQLKARPFLVEYACTDQIGASRRVSLQIEGRGGHDLLFRILYLIRCKQNDVSKVVELVRQWNEAHPSVAARLSNAQKIAFHDGDISPRTAVVVLESIAGLEPRSRGISLDDFSALIEDVQEIVRKFTQASTERLGS